MPGHLMTPLHERIARYARDPDWQPLPPPFRNIPTRDPDSPLKDSTCPCCGYKTICAGFNRCEICGWLYAPQQEGPDVQAWSNGVTLREAQANFQQCSVSHDGLTDFVRAPTGDDHKDLAWEPLPYLKPHQRPRDIRHRKRLSKLTCPVCGFKAMRESIGRCPICLWHYYLGHRDELDHSKPNPVSLREAQLNFERFGAYRKFPRGYWRRPRKPTTEDVRDPEWKPVRE